MRGARLVLRIGIATGNAVVASRAVNDVMATGEVPNLAGRLQAVGEGITVSDTTRRLLAQHLEAERLDPLSSKGFSSPVTAYRARAPRGTERRHVGVTGLSSAVVGRDQEQAAISACRGDLRRGRGQVVSIVGRGTLPVRCAEHKLRAHRTRTRRDAGHRPDQAPSSGSDAQAYGRSSSAAILCKGGYSSSGHALCSGT